MVLEGLAEKAGLAAALLEAWARLTPDSVQSYRSLVESAQLGVTEEGATRDFLERCAALGLAEKTNSGYLPTNSHHARFERLALALYAVDHYQLNVHEDETTAQVVLTKPPNPSVLEQKLSALGWRTSELEATEQAFKGMIKAARRRIVVMTPFFDSTGATWLRGLLQNASDGVERVLVLRSLESDTRKDYPTGLDSIHRWIQSEGILVFSYSIPRADGGRETFHAKALLCDRNFAYLGSSNINAASLEYSMELGVVLHGRAAASVATVMDAVLQASIRWL